MGVNLEDLFWHALRDIAVAKGTTRPRLIKEINQTRTNANLSSAVRVFILAYYEGLRA
jgi:predicted DNA-binding ribbon-helix-helix protein